MIEPFVTRAITRRAPFGSRGDYRIVRVNFPINRRESSAPAPKKNSAANFAALSDFRIGGI
jgi:hypothetical protein